MSLYQKKIISYEKDRDSAIEPRRKDYDIGSRIHHLLLWDIYKILSLKKELPEYLTSLIREVRLTKKPKPIISIENLPNKIKELLWKVNFLGGGLNITENKAMLKKAIFDNGKMMLPPEEILTVSTQISIQQYAF